MKKIMVSSLVLALSLSLKLNIQSHQTEGHKDANPIDWKSKLSTEDFEQLKQTFDIFGQDGSGTIDPAEIISPQEELELEDTENPILLKLKEANTSINFDQFV